MQAKGKAAKLNAQEPLVYLKGKMIPASQAHVAIYDASVVLGATVTDLVRTFRHRLFRLEDHIARFYRSCKYTRIYPVESADETTRICRELTERNAALLKPEEDLSLVLFLSPGELKIYAGGAGMSGKMEPTFCMHTFPIPFYLWKQAFTDGIHVVTPSIRHVPPQCVDPKIKCRSRMHWWLADQEAHLTDPKAVALCLDLDGNVTETGGSNFLIVKNGSVISPLPRNILPGISMLTVMDLCREMQIPFVERDFQVHDVMNADEAFLPTTPYSLAPVTRINGVSIGDGRSGPMFKRLTEAWSRLVGMDIVKQILDSSM
ncbi:MAG: aminotransferase class IV [Kiritimatiellaeota bacterium]|nr:aminotransferase class IV [Kiritimatiellota bacterium]